MLPPVPKPQKHALLHRQISIMVGKYGRDNYFSIENIHNPDGGRSLIQAISDLPFWILIEDLKAFQAKHAHAA